MSEVRLENVLIQIMKSSKIWKKWYAKQKK